MESSTNGPASETAVSVAICIITCRRPLGLEALLQGIAHLRLSGEPASVRVVVVDNDRQQSAWAVVEAMRPQLRWPLHYAVEPRRGVPYARNTSVRLAGDVDFFVFIDDDEVPEPHWLDVLLGVQRRYQADLVAGPVLARYDRETPRWIRKGRFFERPRHRTGLRLPFANTNNLLVSRAVRRHFGTCFDETYGLSGGSDTHFTWRARDAGFHIVWADEAVVHERMLASRATQRWLVQRAYRMGNNMTLCERELRPRLGTRLVRLGKTAVWMVLGILTVVPASLMGRRWMTHALRALARAAGMMTGLAGNRYNEYERIHTLYGDDGEGPRASSRPGPAPALVGADPRGTAE